MTPVVQLQISTRLLQFVEGDLVHLEDAVPDEQLGLRGQAEAVLGPAKIFAKIENICTNNEPVGQSQPQGLQGNAIQTFQADLVLHLNESLKKYLSRQKIFAYTNLVEVIIILNVQHTLHGVVLAPHDGLSHFIFVLITNSLTIISITSYSLFNRISWFWIYLHHFLNDLRCRSCYCDIS